MFGVVHYDTVDGQQKTAFADLKKALNDGGVKIAADLPFLLDLARAQENARTMIAKLKDERVTSVIFTGDPLTPSSLTKEATAQNYFPEWVIGSNVLVDTAIFGRTFDQEQWQHAFGLALTPDRTNQDARESYNLYKWMSRRTPPPNNTYAVILVDPTILFLGLQLAGPNLTAESFENGLFRSPILGGTPISPTSSRGKHGLWPGVRLRRQRRRRHHLVGPGRRRRGRGRQRREGPLPVHEGGQALHPRQDAHREPRPVRRRHVHLDLQDDPTRVRTARLPVTGEVARHGTGGPPPHRRPPERAEALRAVPGDRGRDRDRRGGAGGRGRGR